MLCLKSTGSNVCGIRLMHMFPFSCQPTLQARAMTLRSKWLSQRANPTLITMDNPNRVCQAAIYYINPSALQLIKLRQGPNLISYDQLGALLLSSPLNAFHLKIIVINQMVQNLVNYSLHSSQNAMCTIYFHLSMNQIIVSFSYFH